MVKMIMSSLTVVGWYRARLPSGAAEMGWMKQPKALISRWMKTNWIWKCRRKVNKSHLREGFRLKRLTYQRQKSRQR